MPSENWVDVRTVSFEYQHWTVLKWCPNLVRIDWPLTRALERAWESSALEREGKFNRICYQSCTISWPRPGKGGQIQSNLLPIMHYFVANVNDGDLFYRNYYRVPRLVLSAHQRNGAPWSGWTSSGNRRTTFSVMATAGEKSKNAWVLHHVSNTDKSWK